MAKISRIMGTIHAKTTPVEESSGPVDAAPKRILVGEYRCLGGRGIKLPMATILAHSLRGLLKTLAWSAFWIILVPMKAIQRKGVFALFLTLSSAAAIEPIANWNGDSDDPNQPARLESGVSSPDALDGKGFEFDGIGAYVSTDLPVSPIDMPQTTWMAWVNPRDLNGRRLVLEADDAGFDRFIAIENGKFGVGTGRGIWFPVEASTGTWQHVAVVFTPDSIRFYLNGEEFTCPEPPQGQASETRFRFGGSPLWEQYFDGLLDEVRVYDQALSHEQIRAEFERLRDIAKTKMGPIEGERGNGSDQVRAVDTLPISASNSVNK